MRRIGWAEWALAVVGAALTTAYLAVPFQSLPSDVFYNGVNAAALAACAVGARRATGVQRHTWWLVAAYLACVLVGNLVWLKFTIEGVDPFPTVADASYLGGYVFLAAAAGVLGTSRRSVRDRWVWLDSGLLTLVAGLILWVTVMEPSIADPTLSWAAS